MVFKGCLREPTQCRLAYSAMASFVVDCGMRLWNHKPRISKLTKAKWMSSSCCQQVYTTAMLCRLKRAYANAYANAYATYIVCMGAYAWVMNVSCQLVEFPLYLCFCIQKKSLLKWRMLNNVPAPPLQQALPPPPARKSQTLSQTKNWKRGTDMKHSTTQSCPPSLQDFTRCCWKVLASNHPVRPGVMWALHLIDSVFNTVPNLTALWLWVGGCQIWWVWSWAKIGQDSHLHPPYLPSVVSLLQRHECLLKHSTTQSCPPSLQDFTRCCWKVLASNHPVRPGVMWALHLIDSVFNTVPNLTAFNLMKSYQSK